MTEQRICAVMEHHEYLAETDDTYQQNRREIEAFSSTARIARRTSVIRIPVVVHVLYHSAKQNISSEQIDSQIDALNRDFRLQNIDKDKIPKQFRSFAADTLIEFQLACRDPIGRPTTGITRTYTDIKKFPYDQRDRNATAKLDNLIKRGEHGKTAWPRDDYLNIWVCAISSGLLGYAQFPGGPAGTDGVVINNTAFGTMGTAKPPFDLGRTTTHEIGHWLNLLHIWGDDNGGCSLSDNVYDTPNQAGPNYEKPAFPKLSCENDPNGDMFMNYMDYVDDDSMLMFTSGQVRRMNAALVGPRSTLTKSKGLERLETEAIAILKDAQTGVATTLRPAQETGGGVSMTFDGVSWIGREE